jgi:hypothetical protein
MRTATTPGILRSSLLASALLVAGALPVDAQRPTVSVGAVSGYQNGLAVQAFAVVEDLAPGLPVQVRVRFGHTAVEPGSATQARRIFINNATNGTPEKRGHTWDTGLDVLVRRSERTHLFLGVRRTSFLANFRYVGGNEDFDVRSTHWGFGGGLEATYPVGRRAAILVSGGVDYYLPSRLQGHDTSYSPDNDNVNPREAFTYSEADDAIHQPVLRPMALVGLRWRLGR